MPDYLRNLLMAAAAAVLVLVVLLICNRVSKQKGIAGEKRVAGVLKQYARKNRGTVWNNAFLPLYKESCEIDHLIFGAFGVAVIETKNVGGTVSGNGKELTQKIGSKVHKLRNPQLQNKTHIDNVVHHLRKAGLNNVPVHGIVVFSNPDVTLETDAGIPLSRLPKALDKLPRQRGTRGEDAAYRALRAVRIKSPVKKLLHDFRTGRKK